MVVPSGRLTRPWPSIAIPLIVLVMPAQIGIAKKGGVSIARGAPLRVEWAGISAASRPARTALL